MARHRSGIGFEQSGKVYTGIRLRDGRRWSRPVATISAPPANVDPIEWARAVSLSLQSRYDAREWDPEAKAEASAPTPAAALTVGEWCGRWSQRLTHSSADDDRRRLEYVAQSEIAAVPLAEVGRQHAKAFVAWLREQPSARGSTLAPRTVRNAWDVLRRALRDAREDGLLSTVPDLPHGALPEIVDKDPSWRARAVFSAREVVMLLTDERIPSDRRTLYALLFLTGVRFGEAAALRWCDYDPARTPLGALHVHASMHKDKHERKATKTGVAREVPVVDALALVLRRWRETEWHHYFDRAPMPTSPLVPSRDNDPRTVRHAHNRLVEDCARLGLPPRRLHDTRATFVSIARDGGARLDVLRWISHGGSKRQIVDVYSRLSWTTLCRELDAMRSVTDSVTAALTPAREKRESPAISGTAGLSALRGGRDSNPSDAPKTLSLRWIARTIGLDDCGFVTGSVTDVTPRGDAVLDAWGAVVLADAIERDAVDWLDAEWP